MSGSHLTLISSGAPSRAESANIFPPTLKTETSSPNGNSSAAPGSARQAVFSSCWSMTGSVLHGHRGCSLGGVVGSGLACSDRGMGAVPRRGDLAAGFLGPFRQQQYGPHEEADRADERAQVRPLGVAQVAGRRADVTGHRGHAKGDGAEQV